MLLEYTIKLVHNHILIDDGQKLILDTGSPLSFHKYGKISIEENTIAVSQSLPGINSSYLTNNIGCEIHGLLGMDILKQHPVLISLKDGFMFFDDDNFDNTFLSANNSQKMGGLIGVEIILNGRKARMIVDSGAPISYVNNSYTNGTKSKYIKSDFSPYIGKFQTVIYDCAVDLLVNQKCIMEFGSPPPVLKTMLRQLNVDGILGVELFKRFRLHIRGGRLHFPPQGI